MGRKWWKKNKRRHHKQKLKAKAPTVIAPVADKPKVTTWEPQPICHEGVVGVFMKEKLHFWAGKARDVHQWNDWDLVICFSDRDSQWEDNDPRPFFTHNQSALKLLSPELFMQAPRAPFIGIDWPDYGSPGLSRAWWEQLIADLMRIDKETVNVAICCTGGHGRTGSALSILHGLCWPNAVEDPVEMVRRIYCRHCVESTSQIEYIEDIVGREIKAKPSWIRPIGGGKPSGASGYYSQYTTPGDNKPQGSAAATKLAEIETARALNEKKDYAAIVQKAVENRLKDDYADESEDVWKQEDFVPFGADMMKPGFTYSPIMNAAGDIIGWKERKDVTI